MQDKLSRICLFCASSPGIDDIYFKEAKILAHELAAHNIAINYGGGAKGLMGLVSEILLQKDKKLVRGFIPDFMRKMGWSHQAVDDMVVVRDMHERKYLMRKDVDAIIALPGGVGTLEELMEVITLKQLGQFTKPIVILNTRNFYTPLHKILNKMAKEHFMRDIHTTIWQIVNDPKEVIPAIINAPAWDAEALKFAAVEKH